MITATQKEDIEAFVRDFLTSRLDDSITLDPIVVREEIDQYGDKYVHVYVIYESDEYLLPQSVTSKLGLPLWDYTTELGFKFSPTKTYINKSEWEGEFWGSLD